MKLAVAASVERWNVADVASGRFHGLSGVKGHNHGTRADVESNQPFGTATRLSVINVFVIADVAAGTYTDANTTRLAGTAGNTGSDDPGTYGAGVPATAANAPAVSTVIK